jgi:hypothetical protein
MIGILFYTKTHFNVSLKMKTLFFSILTALIIAALSRVLPRGDWSFLVSGTILFFGYFALLRLVRELRDDDIAPILRLFNSPKEK